MGRGKSSVGASSLTAGFAAAGIITRPGGAPMPKGTPTDALALAPSLAAGVAAQHLIGRGYTILDSSAENGPGRLGIVAQQGSTLIFVQVTVGFLPAASASQASKNASALRRDAKAWLAAHPSHPRTGLIQFDSIGVGMNADGTTARIAHLESVF